ncbi:MAG: hypothetical protein JXA51_01575 [Dehalococcoidales bacterium]|nr:hypothetical protein [Dehalococcoidales bacterium]
MIEIRYQDNFESAEIAGQTIAEARELYKAAFDIPDKARAELNGNKVKIADEAEKVLCDDDILSFALPHRSKAAYLVGALLLAMTFTLGAFAYGYTFDNVTLGGTTSDANFADVTANTSSTPTWVARGMENKQVDPGTLFDIDTTSSNYTGDFVATVAFANTNKLSKIYRSLVLSLEVRDSLDNIMDINADGNADSNDVTVLTLNNASVEFIISQNTADTYTIQIKSGYYACNAYGSSWGAGYGTPELFCEVVQK